MELLSVSVLGGVVSWISVVKVTPELILRFCEALESKDFDVMSVVVVLVSLVEEDSTVAFSEK